MYSITLGVIKSCLNELPVRHTVSEKVQLGPAQKQLWLSTLRDKEAEEFPLDPVQSNVFWCEWERARSSAIHLQASASIHAAYCSPTDVLTDKPK